MAVKRFTSTARKDGRWWVVQCDQEPGALSQVAGLDQAVELQREAIAFVTDLTVSEIEVEVVPVIDDALTKLLQEASAHREEGDRLQRLAMDEIRKVAHTLAADKYSVRDIGAILGVSYQRAAQLVKQAS